ncbi:putative leucine-rich repeat receptor-like serine/threonine-protein kinase At2g24130 [Miscanthus floridulus]|uniref:putative leucine-rich repeat receptor-like serine/threonine-protein kinase At2g24130 n=1 Tax=Miscanthus floridulus TaxID=154761 RepID=UPI003457D113
MAVKVLHQDLAGGEVVAGSFERECRALRSIRHRNLIRVITACSTPEFKAVVLPFMPNGSLESLIHGPPPAAAGGGKPAAAGPQRLDLDLLLCVASNVAEGMAYLHHHAPVKVVHCDLKPSNVLLDGDMTAVVSNFGISKLVMTDGARDPEVMGDASTSVCNSITRLLQGSVGYIAPEYGLGGRPSTQGDVYSFGVMLLVLEMISGKRPTDVISEEGHGLHDWTKKLQHQQHDLLDSVVERLLLPFGPPLRGEMEVVVVLELIELGVACSQLEPSMRPTMDDVAHEVAYLRDGTRRNYGVTDLKTTTDQKQLNSQARFTV